jgi:predicted HD superfamily hydrolase involved in NAD metabolism
VGRTVELPAWAHVTDKRRAHIARVAQLADEWAVAMRVSASERARWRRAVLLHDTLKDAPTDLLHSLAPDPWDNESLLHGPAAAAAAASHGERDTGVLDAVRYHSVGYADWDDVGRVLYLADFLEPGRKRGAPERERLAADVPKHLRRVLHEVTRQRIEMTLAKGYPLLLETVAFWNSLL